MDVIARSIAFHDLPFRCRGSPSRLLIAARAAVDAEQIGSHQTPLFHAASRGDVAAVSSLLWAGADARRCDAHRLTALHYAAKGCRLEIVGALVRESVPVDSSVLDKAGDLLGVYTRIAQFRHDARFMC